MVYEMFVRRRTQDDSILDWISFFLLQMKQNIYSQRWSHLPFHNPGSSVGVGQALHLPISGHQSSLFFINIEVLWKLSELENIDDFVILTPIS